MIDIVAALLMAIFQGIIEWLPISSEGQLSLLFINFYGMDPLEAVTLSLLLHIGTMFSVLWLFRSDFQQMVDLNAKITQVTAIATLGTAITAVPIVLIFKNYWQTWTQNFLISPDILFTLIIGILLIFTGIILAKQPTQGTRELGTITQREALLLGLAQGVAALPGISRSGMTITVLLIIGLTQKEAFRTSFIISVPAVLGATGLEALLSGFSIQGEGLIVGTIVFPYWLLLLTIILTTVVGLATISGLLQLKDLPFDKFCIIFGGGTFLLAISAFIIQVV